MDKDLREFYYSKIASDIDEGESFRARDLDSGEPSAMIEVILNNLAEELPELEKEGDGYILTEKIEPQESEYDPGVGRTGILQEYVLEELDGEIEREDVMETVTDYLKDMDITQGLSVRVGKASTVADNLSENERTKY